MAPYRAFCVLLLLFIAAVSGPTSAADKPNVLFIAIDDLNDWIGALAGHPQTLTPNIDRLAKRGLLFTNAHCSAPACNPSRASLMTGIRPSTSGVYVNPQPWRKAMPTAVTVPQHFMAHGYHALGSGKIYHGAFPDPASWNEYFPSKARQRPGDPLPKGRPLNGIPRTAHFDWGPLNNETAAMADAKVVDWVSQQLQRKWDKPFFLACGIYRPHLPWYVPQDYFDKFPLESIVLPATTRNDLDDVPAAGVRMAKPNGDHKRVTRHKQWKHAVRGYLASINFADDMLGRVIKSLDASPYAKNTIVVLWTDHGWHLGEKSHWRKFALWDRATRTPVIVAAPGVTTAGSRCDRAVSLIDLYPTLVDLCGLAPRAELEGQSLLPLLKDPKAVRKRPALTTHGRNNHAVRSDRWRYIRYADGSEELYDHLSDSNEWKNVAGDPANREVKQELARWLPTKNAAESSRSKKKKSGRRKKRKKKASRKSRDQNE